MLQKLLLFLLFFLLLTLLFPFALLFAFVSGGQKVQDALASGVTQAQTSMSGKPTMLTVKLKTLLFRPAHLSY